MAPGLYLATVSSRIANNIFRELTNNFTLRRKNKKKNKVGVVYCKCFTPNLTI
jgi:hypothetical protein